jgi:hypothetical protein
VKEIVLTGSVIGRAHKHGPLDNRGLPKPASHDSDVTVTFNFPIVGAKPAEFDIVFQKLESGALRIGSTVRMILTEPRE